MKNGDKRHTTIEDHVFHPRTPHEVKQRRQSRIQALRRQIERALDCSTFEVSPAEVDEQEVCAGCPVAAGMEPL